MRAHYTDVAMSVPPAFCAENDIRHVGSPSCSGKLIYSPKEFFVTTYFSKNRTPLLGQALINWTGICFGGFIGTLAAAIPGLIDLLSLTDLTTGEVVGRLGKDWSKGVRSYEGHAHMLMFADTLTVGIAKQFPDKVRMAQQ